MSAEVEVRFSEDASSAAFNYALCWYSTDDSEDFAMWAGKRFYGYRAEDASPFDSQAEWFAEYVRESGSPRVL